MISYAHEDGDFARALKSELEPFYEVWFDQDQLKVGDSLFQQINRGLATSDFGIVIVSPNYVGKTWTNRELAAFMALEDLTKKVILPVWKDIDRAAVAHWAPVMVDRYAAKASGGVAAVAAAVCVAIDSAARALDLVTRSTSGERLAALGRDLKAKADAEALLGTTEGVNLVKADFEQLLGHLEVTLKAAESPGLKFNIKRSNGTLVAHTRGLLTLNVTFMPRFMNSAADAPLRTGIFQRSDQSGPFSNSTTPSLLEEKTFAPWFVGESVIWRLSEKKVFTATQVVDAIIEMLHRQLERATTT